MGWGWGCGRSLSITLGGGGGLSRTLHFLTFLSSGTALITTRSRSRRHLDSWINFSSSVRRSSDAARISVTLGTGGEEESGTHTSVVRNVNPPPINPLPLDVLALQVRLRARGAIATCIVSKAEATSQRRTWSMMALAGGMLLAQPPRGMYRSHLLLWSESTSRERCWYVTCVVRWTSASSGTSIAVLPGSQ